MFVNAFCIFFKAIFISFCIFFKPISMQFCIFFKANYKFAILCKLWYNLFRMAKLLFRSKNCRIAAHKSPPESVEGRNFMHNVIAKTMSVVKCEAVNSFVLSSGEVITPRKGEGFLEIIILDPPPIREVFFHGEHLKEYISEPEVFFGSGYGLFGVAFNSKKQTAEEAVKAFYAFAEQNWINQEVDA